VVALAWTREQDEGSVTYAADLLDGGRLLLWNSEGWLATWRPAAGVPLEIIASELPTLADAKLAAAAYAVSGTITHKLRFDSKGRPGVVRGSRMTLSNWTCSCGKKQTGNSRSISEARRNGYDLHWRPALTALAESQAD
jgi:hypothetical protein